MLVKFLGGWRNVSALFLTQQTARVIAVATLGLWSLPSLGAPLTPVTYNLSLAPDPGSRYVRHQRLNVISGQNPVEITVGTVTRVIVGTIKAEAYSTQPHWGLAIVDGRSYTVYKLPNLTSIGYVVDVKDPNSPVWLPLNHEAHTPGSLPGRRVTFLRNHFCCRIGIEARITFIKLNDEPLNISQQSYTVNDLFTVRVLRNNNEVARETQKMTVTLNATSPTCRLTGDSTQNIRLPAAPASYLPFVGANWFPVGNNNAARFTMRCGAGVSVYAVLSDANNASNTSEILTNTGSAKGIGVQLRSLSGRTGTPCSTYRSCRYGPDSKARGTINQFMISSNTTSGEIMISEAFRAGYVRTGTVEPGDVQARATITFSYQ